MKSFKQNYCICGKRKYATLEAAERIVEDRQRLRSSRERVESRVYYSEKCGWYHITSQKKYAVVVQ